MERTDEIPRHRAKKDRRRWCGGHEGRDHDWGRWTMAYGPWKWEISGMPVGYERQDCLRCGKHGPLREVWG